LIEWFWAAKPINIVSLKIEICLEAEPGELPIITAWRGNGLFRDV
jgi:hypothetical protein